MNTEPNLNWPLMKNNITRADLDAVIEYLSRDDPPLTHSKQTLAFERECSQPMKEEYLLTGPLEPINEAYAIAKIAGIKLCQAYKQQYGVNFIAGIPANIFGPGDDFSLGDSHVIAALIRKMHEAKLCHAKFVEIWGTGSPRREFIFADDLASACIFVMREYDGSQPINLGGECDLSIRELAVLIKEVVGYPGELRFDTSKPDGMPMKILDSSKLRRMGWQPKTPFRSALSATYDGFLQMKQKGIMQAPASACPNKAES